MRCMGYKYENEEMVFSSTSFSFIIRWNICREIGGGGVLVCGISSQPKEEEEEENILWHYTTTKRAVYRGKFCPEGKFVILF